MGLINPIRYGLVYIATAFGLGIGLEVLLRVTGIDLSSSATSIMPAMIAAMFEGQKRAQSDEGAFTNGEAWTAAMVMTVVALGITAILGFFMSFLPEWSRIFGSFSVGIWVLLVAISGIVSLLVNRFFLTLGFKNKRKIMDRKIEDDFS
ncbi:ABZJ_00895 family protein [Halocynthiibacter sp.]|uniref:ABZJ_00895 family protein n=1 Tax=Halocynthiibacter sp. TaxID=1979210 RepID=UPI003C511835